MNTQKEVNPHFKPVWTTKKPHNVLKSGRNSFKFSVIVLLLVFMMIGYIIVGKKPMWSLFVKLLVIFVTRFT